MITLKIMRFFDKISKILFFLTKSIIFIFSFIIIIILFICGFVIPGISSHLYNRFIEYKDAKWQKKMNKDKKNE